MLIKIGLIFENIVRHEEEIVFVAEDRLHKTSFHNLWTSCQTAVQGVQGLHPL